MEVQPTPGLHESIVHASWSSQTTGVPRHGPGVLQVSRVVQALLSLHATPGVGVCTQPLPGEHESAVHALPSSQLIVCPTHWPCALQVSCVVQALLSLHATPGVGVCTQPLPGEHESAVHALPSSQLIVCPTHWPCALQVSCVVQAL